MSKGIKLKGTVVREHGNGKFAVELDNGADVLAHLSGKIRTRNIHILVGDSVEVEVSPYDLSKGRITYRL